MFTTALILFGLSFLFIITEKVHRTVAALTGAALMVLLGVISQDRALEGVDFNTIGLLIGMMVLVGIAKHSGMFQAMALYIVKKARGNPMAVYILLGLLVMIFSALLDNVTTVLLLVPVIMVITNNLNVSPYPYLVSTILLSNIGGAMTLIGDPPNILIGSAAHLSFNDFLIHLLPVCVIIAVVTIFGLVLVYKKDFVTTKEARASVLKFSPREAITDMPLLKHSLIAIGVVIVGFLTHDLTGLDGATIALSGAALLLVLSLRDPEDHLKDVEWPTIFFFVGLFILVTGIEEVGIIDGIAHYILQKIGSDGFMLAQVILWGSAFMSAIVDNIPFVTAMIPLITEINAAGNMPENVLWWSLALGADIGGNATLVGASANVIVAGLAKKENQHMSFLGYMKVALPFTMVALVISSIYIAIRYF